MDYYSLLSEGEKGFVRMDYCVACWKKHASAQADTAPISSHWRSKVPFKKGPARLPEERKERALEILKEALTREGEDDRSEAFVLALYLARKKQLYLRKEMKKPDGQIIYLYEVAVTEEMLAVPKLKLSKLQIERVQAQIASILNFI